MTVSHQPVAARPAGQRAAVTWSALQAQHSHLQDKINWYHSQISATQRRSRSKTGK
jgi:hypothetical protein